MFIFLLFLVPLKVGYSLVDDILVALGLNGHQLSEHYGIGEVGDFVRRC